MRTLSLFVPLLAAPVLLPAIASAAWVCTDMLYDDTCPSTLCVSLSPPTAVCTPRNSCLVGETRCIGYLACVLDDTVFGFCVVDPCYTTACFADPAAIRLP